MKTFISILRGINVSGQKKILMTDLKSLYESLGLKEVLTYIQSGNVIFKTAGVTSNEELAKRIEKTIAEKYGFEVPVVIRSVHEIDHVISINPFLKSKAVDTEKLHITFLATTPSPATIENIKTFTFPPDEFIILDKEVFLHIPGSYGETKLSNKFFESKLKVAATTRNWKTVNKLLELGKSS